MINKLFFLRSIFIVCMVMLSGLHAEDFNSYEYTNVFNPTKTIWLDVKEKRIVVGDVGTSILFCGHEDEYICFSNQHIAFAVPTANIEVLDKWEIGGIEFKNNGIRKIKILDTFVEAYNIVTDIAEVKYNFLYSEDLGLIAIGIFDLEMSQGNTYLLSGKYGFAYSVGK